MTKLESIPLMIIHSGTASHPPKSKMYCLIPKEQTSEVKIDHSLVQSACSNWWLDLTPPTFFCAQTWKCYLGCNQKRDNFQIWLGKQIWKFGKMISQDVNLQRLQKNDPEWQSTKMIRNDEFQSFQAKMIPLLSCFLEALASLDFNDDQW